MSDLELLISKYLDDEVSAAELAELQHRIATDPDARAAYSEMTSIRRAARRAPTTRTPLASTEIRLFEQLRREGFSDAPSRPASAEPVRRRTVVGSLSMAAVAMIAMIAMFVAPRMQQAPPSSGADAVASRTATAPTSTTIDAAPTSPLASAASEAPSLATDGRQHALPTRARGVEAARARTVMTAPQAAAVYTTAAATLAVVAPQDFESASDTALTAASEPSPVDQSAITNEPPLIELTSGTDTTPAILPVPGVGTTSEPLLSATLRYGPSFISRATDALSEEVSVGLDFNIGDGHRLALLGGRSAAVTEQRATNTHEVVARVAVEKDGARLARTEAAPAPYDIEVGKEWWVGIGYNYSVNQGGPVEFSIGARGAVGPRSLHIGAEAPVRFHVSRRFAVELIPSVAHIVPHDRQRNEFSIDNASDGYLYEAESQHTAFSTFGGAIGVRIVLD